VNIWTIAANVVGRFPSLRRAVIAAMSVRAERLHLWNVWAGHGPTQQHCLYCQEMRTNLTEFEECKSHSFYYNA
jgi:hypothetical protein